MYIWMNVKDFIILVLQFKDSRYNFKEIIEFLESKRLFEKSSLFYYNLRLPRFLEKVENDR